MADFVEDDVARSTLPEDICHDFLEKCFEARRVDHAHQKTPDGNYISSGPSLGGDAPRDRSHGAAEILPQNPALHR